MHKQQIYNKKIKWNWTVSQDFYLYFPTINFRENLKKMSKYSIIWIAIKKKGWGYFSSAVKA